MLSKCTLLCIVAACLVGHGDTANGTTTAPATRDRSYIILPMPMEMPDRNDRSEQCWLRIEDIEIVDTITMFCYVAQEFLGLYIPKYNLKKQKEDGINYVVDDDDDFRKPVSPLDDDSMDRTNLNVVNSWKSHSVIDSITGRRIYVSKKAICRLLMYSREGMSSYQVDCPEIIKYIHSSNNSGVLSNFPCVLLCAVTLTLSVLIG